MNPSAKGWIPKLLQSLSDNKSYVNKGAQEIYDELRKAGFIYGSSRKIAGDFVQVSDLTMEELSKANLLIGLNSVYKSSEVKEGFVKHLLEFYKALNQDKSNFLDDIFGDDNPETTLEKIIHKRVQIDQNILTKNFNFFVTNALLFVDVLAYIKYVSTGEITENYLKKLEGTIESVSLKALNSKKQHSKHDKSLMALISSSLRYRDFQDEQLKDSLQHIDFHSEKKYLFDIACMVTWSDQKLDHSETRFLKNLSKKIELSKEDTDAAKEAVDNFYKEHKDDLELFNSKNIMQNFYNNSSKMVNTLLKRNKKRLQKELEESKEIMGLLRKSTREDLSKEEQKKLQNQLIDIFKTIPSLAIFILPGGAILLPIVIKFIPGLLPSAFKDNQLEEDS